MSQDEDHLRRAVRIVDGLIVDDYYSLWEIVDAVAGGLPSADKHAARVIAEQALLHLIRTGRAMLAQGVNFTGEEAEIPADQSEAALRGAAWTMGPTSLRDVRATASDARVAEFLGDRKPDGL